MCGIVGCIKRDASEITSSLIKEMSSYLKHRGPDDFGCLITKIGDVSVGLGHRRLAILDLSPSGHQPMSFEGLHVSYNGEIYNFLELRKELENFGYNFNSNSDTEIILKSYHKWGISAINKFIGIFAFALVDSKNELLYLVRDRAGVKPLYYFSNPTTILFSSELKSFKANVDFDDTIDFRSLSLYFKYGYVPAPRSIFAGTNKVQPGTYIKVDLKAWTQEIKVYWDPIAYVNKPKLRIGYNEATRQLEELLISSFKYRMVSDVPVGVFLSGGYDSSIVAAILQKHTGSQINTFSIGFNEEKYNEAHHAKNISNYLGTKHHEEYCSIDVAKGIIQNLPKMFDEPFGDSSAVPTSLVSQFAAKHVKVVLSADGGDELFAGYGQYFYFLKLFSNFKKIPRSLNKPIIRILNSLHYLNRIGGDMIYNFDSRIDKVPRLLESNNILEFNEIVSEFFTSSELSNLLKTNFSNLVNDDLRPQIDLSVNDELNALLGVSYITSLPGDMLTKVDRATMFSSIEGREPMLDHRLFEFVSQLPSEFKYKEGVGKRILKDITHNYIPKELMDRPKMGFSIPVESWLKGDLYYLIDEYVDPNKNTLHDFFTRSYLEKIIKEFQSGRQFNFAKIWYILMFQMWYKDWYTK